MTATASTLFLRRVLGLDAVASGGVGLLMGFGPALLADLLQLDPGVTRPAGLFLIGWALAVAALALRPSPAKPLVLAVIAVNILWVIESGLSLALGWVQPNALGVAFVVAQAAAVAGFAGLQLYALRPAQRAV
jgi:CHASE2 domain-containing sensor protein